MRMIAATVAAALLYGAGAITANPAFAGGGGNGLTTAQVDALKEMRTGATSTLVIHPEARAPVDGTFLTADGAEIGFDAFRGEVLVVNFWATWCPPCRKEMPALDRLRAEIAGPDIDVIAINIEHRGLKKAARFYGEIGVEALDIYADESGALPRSVGAMGFPTTLILDRQGREIARMQGDTEWDAPEVKALLARIVADTKAPEVIKAGLVAPDSDG